MILSGGQGLEFAAHTILKRPFDDQDFGLNFKNIIDSLKNDSVLEGILISRIPLLFEEISDGIWQTLDFN